MKQYNLSMNLENIANSSILKSCIEDNINDPWKNTPYFGYRHINNPQKGVYGELFTSLLIEGLGFKVDPPQNRGHDRIISGYKTEIKFSLSHADKNKNGTIPNQFTMNHVSVDKDWDRLIFVGINHPETQVEPLIFWFSNQDFRQFTKSDQFFNCFTYQQGGETVGNDDYISAAAKLRRLSKSEIARSLEEW